MTWLISLIGLPRLIGYGAAAFAVWFAWETVQSTVDRYTGMSGKIAILERDNALYKSRLDSYNLRIERRDEAIAASKCAATIQDWIKHPDKIPAKFDLFNVLGN